MPRITSDAEKPGVIKKWGTNTAPAGYLACEGQSLLRADYPRLFAAIGTTWGSASGTTFNLPDMRGRFPRGRANGSTRDPDRASRSANAAGGLTGDNVGSVQTDEFISHPHSASATSTINWTDTANGETGEGRVVSGGSDAHDQPITGGISVSTSVTVNPNGGNETRPENASFLFIIKY